MKILPLQRFFVFNMKLNYVITSFLLLAPALFSCHQDRKYSENGAFASPKELETKKQGYDLGDIQESGELIVATLSGPDTYYDFQGEPMGLQYAYAVAFAKEEGLRVRVEIAHDTLELFQMLEKNEVDLIALPMPKSLIQKHGAFAAGLQDSTQTLSWATNQEAEGLIQSLNRWYNAGAKLAVETKEKERNNNRHRVHRKVRAPYISRQKGIISNYDRHFHNAAQVVGWDWHLIAAQCYQESGFDPGAISGAGARGLMQIMPSTAQFLGVPVEHLFYPEKNIAAAAKYLKILNEEFKDIPDTEERIKFVLAAYNGGAGHIRDAMALTRKNGGNARRWDDVAVYVGKLSEPQFYRDPSVRYGYMIGQETTNYVSSVIDRWRYYGRTPTMKQSMQHEGRPGRTATKHRAIKIYQPDDPEFSGAADLTE